MSAEAYEINTSLRLRSVFRCLAVWFALLPSPAARRSPAWHEHAKQARASFPDSAPLPPSKAICWEAPAARQAAPAKRPSALQPAPAPGARLCQAAAQLQQTPCPPQARAACVPRVSEHHTPARAAPLSHCLAHIAWCSSEMHTSGASPYALMTSNCGTPNTPQSGCCRMANRCGSTNLLLHPAPDRLHVRPHFSNAAHALLRAPGRVSAGVAAVRTAAVGLRT